MQLELVLEMTEHISKDVSLDAFQAMFNEDIYLILPFYSLVVFKLTSLEIVNRKWKVNGNGK